MKNLFVVLILVGLMTCFVALTGGCQQQTGIAAGPADHATSNPSDNTNQNPGDNGSEWYGKTGSDM
jgi:hypothetical protein